MPVVNRRNFIAVLGGASLAPPGSALAGSHLAIRSIKLGQPFAIAESHGDTWAPARANDGNLYSPSDDTFGFHHVTDSNIAFNVLEGDDPIRLKGTTINPMTEYGRSSLEGADGCTWKSSGCAFIDNALYWVVARHKYGQTSGDPHLRQTAANASIIRSVDYGRTWVRTERENREAPMFPGSRFAAPYFVQYPPGGAEVDGAGQFVYAISNNGFWDNGDSIILGRVLRSKIAALSGDDWEYYVRGDSPTDRAWTKNMSEAVPVLEKPGRLGMTGAVYVPERGCYLMISWYFPAGGGKITGACTHTAWYFYVAPRPWGPWRQIGSHHFAPQGFYCPQICPKFLSGDRAYIFAAGNWNEPKYYHLTVIPLEMR